MRTTVTLDPDVEQLIRERMAAKQISFTQALNDAVRDGANDTDNVFDMPVHDLGVSTLDLNKANQLAAELEDEEIVASLRAG